MKPCANCTTCKCNVYPCLTQTEDDVTHRPILVVGESVTAVEAKNNRIMSGKGGEILRDTMKQVGLPIDEKSTYFTTAIACAVPKKKGANPIPPEAMSNCRTRLLDIVRSINPRLILVCGKVAMQTLTGDSKLKISEMLGRSYKYSYCGDAEVIPIQNPGALIYAPGEYKSFLASLTLAAASYGGHTKEAVEETKWVVIRTKEEAYALWQKMNALHKEGKLPWASYDIETTGLDYRVVEFCVMGICFEKGTTYVFPREMRTFVHNFLDGVPWKCIWQHGKYDKKVMWRRELAGIRIDEDTIYMHYVLDETSEHNLGYLSKVFLQAQEYKYKMNQNWKAVSLETYPQFFEALCERVAVDCDYTLQLANVLTERRQEFPKLDKLYKELIIPAANYLARVEQNGVLVNQGFLNDLNAKYDILVSQLKDEVEELSSPFWDPDKYKYDTGAKTAPDKFNPGAPLQMSWMVFDRLRLNPRIKKGRSTDKDILKSIENAPPLIKKVLEYRTVQKEQSTYVQGILDKVDPRDGRVHANFNLHVTATGRLSSTEPNMQNQPSGNGVGNVRQAFIASPGYILAEIDYSGAELRWLAFLSQCPVLLDVFIQGRNLHNETAVALYGIDYSKAEKLRAKAVNFGIPYGRESQSFVDEFNITKQEAQQMIDGWLNKYHGARDYLNWCAAQVIQGNWLETPFGRRRRFGLVTKESLHNLQNEARNFPIQSSSSDLLLSCGIDMEDTLLKNWDTKQLNLVHDSILLEIPDDPKIIREVGIYADSVLVQQPIKLFNCNVPFKTDFEVGYNWGELYGFNTKTGLIEHEHAGEVETFDFYDWRKKRGR